MLSLKSKEQASEWKFIKQASAAGPDVGGSHGPYRQTERKETYMKYVDQMIRANQAYPCFCTDEELEEMRKSAEAEGRPPVYSGALCCDMAIALC